MTTENKKPSDAAMRAISALLEDMKSQISLNHDWSMIGDTGRARVMESWARIIESAMTTAPAIQPGDVVTLASGGEPWTVAIIEPDPNARMRAEIWRERTEQGEAFQIARVPIAALRKVEPEPADMEWMERARARRAAMADTSQLLPGMNVATLQLLRRACWRALEGSWLTEEQRNDLRRWLDAAAPIAVARTAMDEEARAALVDIATWIVSEAGGEEFDSAQSRIGRWLAAQRGA